MRRVKSVNSPSMFETLSAAPSPLSGVELKRGRERKSIGKDLDPRGATSDVAARAVAVSMHDLVWDPRVTLGERGIAVGRWLWLFQE
jgi:hypothetical protein